MPDRMPHPDTRWRQRLQNFKSACDRLNEAVELAGARELSPLEQQGLIQAFEFTHELAWNTLKDFLETTGATNLFGSVNATPAAFAAGLIEDGEMWMEMIKSRNLTSHTYDQRVADQIAGMILSRYAAAFAQFRRRFEEMEGEGE